MTGGTGDDATGRDALARLFPGHDPTSAAHRATDWAATPLGPVDTWPAELRAAIRTVLPSTIPMLVWWGPELVQIFNHAYTPMLGDKYPAAIGQPAAQCWPDVWDAMGPLADGVLAGGGSAHGDRTMLYMYRRGYWEETYWTFSYSPIHDDSGAVVGVFVATSDVTGPVVGDRRLALLRELGDLSIAEADTAGDAARAAARVLAGDGADLLVGQIHLYDHLFAAVGEEEQGGSAPGELTLVASFGDTMPDGLTETHRRPEVIEALRTGLPTRITGLGDLLPQTRRPEQLAGPPPVVDAVVLPLLATGRSRTVGVLVLGVSPYLPLDEPYRHFIELVGSRVSTALTDVLAYEAQRRRAVALAELDRAKTEFFTDVSHELRTPLTLISAPVQESLADERDPLPAVQRQRLELVSRNVGRLRRLVNDMLDFARIEGGRLDPERSPTDLAALTTGVVESFDHAVRQAGLTYRVDVDPLPRTGHVDRDMWEKVITNLLSNALKYTLHGGIEVRLRGDAEQVTLTVTDTGIGIPADQQPLLFRRFHRVPGAVGRSAEGTGIGLALVQQLVRLHGGTVAVRSVQGEGSTFTVRLPYGEAGGEPAADVLRRPDRAAYPALEPATATPGGGFGAAAVAHPRDTPTVLVVEDNADLRAFLSGLLAPHYRVRTATDGRDGLASALADPPDLVLTDMMMPRLDGTGLLRELRADRRTAGLPVIVLSARAGEEAAVEGLRAGADDYLAKPFSSEELLARVRSHLELSRLRSHEATWRAALIDSLQDAFAVVEPDGTLVEANDAYFRLIGSERIELPAPTARWWPDAELEPAQHHRIVAAFADALRVGSGRVTLPMRHTDGHRIWVEAVYNSVREPRTDRRLYVATLRDVTTEVGAVARSEALATLASRLAGASDIAEVLDAGLGELCEVVRGARGVAVALDGAGAPVVVEAGIGLSARVREVLAGLRPDGEPYLDRDAGGRLTGVGTRIEPGAEGGVWLEVDPPRPVAAVDLPLLRQLCAALAQALVRARAYETQRAVALAMQRAMLGPVELPTGFAVRYEPAVRPLEVGGDWYDVVPLPGDLVGVVVGDCVGRGLPAATVMGQLRNACRALLLQAKSPAEVLGALDDFARMVPGGGNTTVFCAIVDRSLGVLRYSCAGHPPGVLMHPDGSHELLDRAGSVPLASVAVSGRPEAGAQLRAGSTLLLYTDGLVERRRELIDAGISRAVDTLAVGRGLPEGQLVDRLCRDLLPEVRDDDVAVLVYRHREPVVFHATLAAEPAQLHPTREALRDWLAELGVGASDAEAVLIAVGEACANAIEHGYRFAAGGTTTVRGRLRADRLEIEVTDTGGWRDTAASGFDRGRGRLIMARLMDEARVEGSPTGTTVRLVKRVSGDS